MTEHESIADSVSVNPHDESLGANAERAFQTTPIVGKGYKTISDNYKKFASADDAGDVALAAGSLVTDGAGFVASCTADIAGFVLDPVGWLVSNGLNMLLELVQPLQDALHAATGDGPALGDASNNFKSIGEGFVKLADDWVETGDNALVDWKEDAGEAAREALADFALGIKGVGSSAGAVAQTLQMWSMVMTVVEEVIKSIISELVTWMIYIWLPALASSIISLGSSVAAAMTASIAKAGAAFAKVTAKLGKLGKLLDDFVAFLGKWTDDIIKAGTKLAKQKQVAKWTDEGLSGLQQSARALGQSAISGGGKLMEQLTGIDPTSAGNNPRKAVIDNLGKKYDYVETGFDLGQKGSIGGDLDADETRDNLDI